MRRRDFLISSAAVLATACSRPQEPGPGGQDGGQRFQWKMVTSWPPNFPGLGTGAAELARMISRASGGRLTVRIYAAGELVPAFEVFDAVSRGTAEMGHTAAYYWKGKAEAAPFFCTMPFGFNAQEMNAWLYHGGGSNSGGSSTLPLGWCLSLPATPGCRWPAGSSAKSAASRTCAGSRCGSRVSAAR